ncbi:MAG: UPF0175 family protein [Candidatus Methanoperedens sp.]|nr:UPF0175 family protein [Candidatus Methanoperedens sp.]
MKNSTQEHKLRKAIRKYTEGSVSLGKAAEIAGLPERMFMHKLHDIGIPLNLSESDFKKGMNTLIEIKKHSKKSCFGIFPGLKRFEREEV